jgi:tetratricopeptide (TPR) repeat protein
MSQLTSTQRVWSNNAGRIRLGLVLFVFLLGLVVGQFTYRYLTRANRFNDEAVELMNQGKYDSALARLDEALADSPNHVLATYHRGLCLAEKHRWEEALAAFDRTSRLDPGHAQAFFNKGRILWMQSAFEQAIPALTQATDLKSPYPDAWILMAECHYELYLRAKATDPKSSASPALATAAFKTYLKQRPDAPDVQTVERKLEVLQHVERYPEVLAKRQAPPRPD